VTDRVALAWSGGKDSTLALAALRRDGVDVVALQTTFTEPDLEVTLHRVPAALIRAQAAALGLPLAESTIPVPCPNEVYEQRMTQTLDDLLLADVPTIAFGDLYLADIRAYREERLARVGRRPLFPLWGRDTTALAREVVRDWRAVVVAVDTDQLDASFVGRPYDDAFLADLPDGVDPCGENGEFHTFVWDGPLFARSIVVAVGEPVSDGRFVHAPLHPDP
jgi:uncharacterized protein (TIGR00290 family)